MAAADLWARLCHSHMLTTTQDMIRGLYFPPGLSMVGMASIGAMTKVLPQEVFCIDRRRVLETWVRLCLSMEFRLQSECTLHHAVIDITVSCKSPVAASVKRDITDAMKELNNSAHSSEETAAHSSECFAAFSYSSINLYKTKAALPANMTGIYLWQCISVSKLSQQCQQASPTKMPHSGQLKCSNWMRHPGRCSCVSLKQNQIQSEEMTHAGGCCWRIVATESTYC